MLQVDTFRCHLEFTVLRILADAKFAKARDANAVIAARLSVFIAVPFGFVSWAKNAAGLLMPSSLDEHH